MKYVSWNVNGVRAVAKKGFAEAVKAMEVDAICLQETKATPEQVEEAVAELEEYSVYAVGAERKGYSGTAILTKVKPLSVSYGIGIEEHDTEGRVITCEFDEHYLVTTYVPNSGNGLKRLDYRSEWDVAMLNYLKGLEESKPVIWCGDLNVAHREIDIARPKSNYNKTAGYTQTEIDGMTRFLESGMIDTFRSLHPDEVKYSWWSYRGGAREKNIGWRLDYFLVSESLESKVKEAFILNEVEGSDHCPVGVVLS
ncbi:MAG: exodeoxyribonuclease III [Bacteroidetes bacterium]|uniref:Exodeoxyribonuclease III n=1 Tax=Phaeocystidibacter marisrubri TaxID=1577780 RepID=A0A6L3ZCT9_9FLAO|nr:exodeoxyribonuclease III [Phaeocystidibacter marisrubri]KAB2815673.1 exodeoxyribonuclease III [Phaeocystidibacter marisrubri]TNE28063.1 MAG: exodeoxyribonuclease III [Bacteroidota bacterium]GGH65113.1 exodeoxyribonuclease [Phaeocystidibacter marisrubri]